MARILGTISSSFVEVANSFESISTVSVGSGGPSDIEFTAIPSTYSHLQIRGVGKDKNFQTQQLYMQFNSDTGSNYTNHYIFAQTSTVYAGTVRPATAVRIPYPISLNSQTGFGAIIIDILDYSNVNKNTTTRHFGGYVDNNTTDKYINFSSALWLNTSAITSIKLFLPSSQFGQYSHFALYGIKAAS